MAKRKSPSKVPLPPLPIRIYRLHAKLAIAAAGGLLVTLALFAFDMNVLARLRCRRSEFVGPSLWSSHWPHRPQRAQSSHPICAAQHAQHSSTRAERHGRRRSAVTASRS
jgi:hypothetical protein